MSVGESQCVRSVRLHVILDLILKVVLVSETKKWGGGGVIIKARAGGSLSLNCAVLVGAVAPYLLPERLRMLGVVRSNYLPSARAMPILAALRHDNTKEKKWPSSPCSCYKKNSRRNGKVHVLRAEIALVNQRRQAGQNAAHTTCLQAPPKCGALSPHPPT